MAVLKILFHVRQKRLHVVGRTRVFISKDHHAIDFDVDQRMSEWKQRLASMLVSYEFGAQLGSIVFGDVVFLVQRFLVTKSMDRHGPG